MIQLADDQSFVLLFVNPIRMEHGAIRSDGVVIPLEVVRIFDKGKKMVQFMPGCTLESGSADVLTAKVPGGATCQEISGFVFRFRYPKVFIILIRPDLIERIEIVNEARVVVGRVK